MSEAPKTHRVTIVIESVEGSDTVNMTMTFSTPPVLRGQPPASQYLAGLAYDAIAKACPGEARVQVAQHH